MSVCVCVCVDGWCNGVLVRSHLSANGSGIGVKIGRPPSLSLPQQGASDGGQRHRQRLVLIVCGHVGDALAAIAHLITGANVEGRVVGRATGAEAASPSSGFGGVGGSRRLCWWQGQWGDKWPVQAGDAAGIAGKVLLRDGAAVRPILLTAVVLQRERITLAWSN